MYRISFVIPRLPTIRNRSARMHWAPDYRERKLWKEEIAAMTAGKRPDSPLQRSLITLTRKSSVMPDPDAIPFGWKGILDGLKSAGIIVDDSSKHIDLISKWVKAPRGLGSVEIVVEEISNGH